MHTVYMIVDSALQSIYRSVVLSKLLYASSSWVGITNGVTLVIGRSYKRFYTGANDLVFAIPGSEHDDFATLCSTSDKQLFKRILDRPEHVLHALLPPPSVCRYYLHNRPHNRLLYH